MNLPHPEPGPRPSRLEGVRRVRPALRSPRLVRLFEDITLLAATRPEAVKTVELVVERLGRPRAMKADRPAVPALERRDRAASE